MCSSCSGGSCSGRRICSDCINTTSSISKLEINHINNFHRFQYGYSVDHGRCWQWKNFVNTKDGTLKYNTMNYNARKIYLGRQDDRNNDFKGFYCDNEGIITTIPLHKKLLNHKKFLNSDFNVSWLDKEKVI